MDDCTVNRSLIAEGCQIGPGCRVENSVIGVRTQVGSNVTIRNSDIMGADYYVKDRAESFERPGLENSVLIDGVLVDKNVRIGAGARLIASDAPDGDGDYDQVAVRDGVAVVKKGAVIPEGWSFSQSGSQESGG
jgi:glucose-1-phosphate adenylyltransferase